MEHRRPRLRPALVALLLALLLAGCAALQPDPPRAAPPPADGPLVRLEPLLAGFDRPVLVLHDPAEPRDAYVVEQGGLVWRVRDGARDADPFLDLTDRTRGRGEQGLLGLAIERDPRPDGSRAVYASYTDLQGDSVLARHRLREGRADPGGEMLLKVDQPFANHNGGHVVLHDGHLYLGLGDGGSANDPHGNGQDPHALLGSLLRLDPTPETGYAIPPDNPYADGEGGAREVYAKGLRNPWRFSFDLVTGDLWLADVGQNALEEVDHVPAGGAKGANFGWNVYEGTRRRAPLSDTFSPHVPPVAEYGRDEGCSVTGGFLYRGAGIPALQGAYVFSDYCSGTLWALRRGGDAGDAGGADGTWRRETLLDTDLAVTSFGQDPQGELLVVDHGGTLHRMVASATR